MTPLERAKAFVQSRAAKTALKILPLALAAVTATTTAKADVLIHPTGASFTGCTVPPNVSCSGLFKLTGSSTSFKPLPLVGVVQGAHSQGIGDAQFPSAVTSTNWDFNFSGDGNSSLDSFFAHTIDTTPITWDFTLNSSDPALTYAYKVYYSFTDGLTTIDNNLLPCASGTTSNLSAVIGSCTASGLTGLGPLTGWNVQLDLQMQDGNKSTVNWNIAYLNVGPQPVTTTTPEPATLTLSALAIPFVLRRLRKS